MILQRYAKKTGETKGERDFLNPVHLKGENESETYEPKEARERRNGKSSDNFPMVKHLIKEVVIKKGRGEDKNMQRGGYLSIKNQFRKRL